MTVLLKDTGFTYVPGMPGTPGSPGTPSAPAYCTTSAATVPGTFEYRSYSYAAGSVAPAGSSADNTYYDSSGVLRYSRSFTVILAVQTSPPTTTTSTVCYPAVAGTPPIASTPGTASQLLTDYNLGWNAGAVGVASQNGDCLLSLQVSPSSVGVVAGLNDADEGAGYGEINYGFYFTHGRAAVYESGVSKLAPVTFVGGDVFKVQRLGQLVRYLKNDTVLYVSAAISTGAVIADASLYAGGDSITSASFGGTTTAPWDSSGGASGSLLPLGGISANKAYVSSNGAMPPLAGAASSRGLNESSGSMLPLGGAASNKPYTSVRSALLPLAGASDSGLLQPSYTLASGGLGALLGISRALTGEVSSVAGMFAPLAGLAANRPYAESRGELLPIAGFGAQAVRIDGYAFLSAPPLFSVLASGHDSTGENAFTHTLGKPSLSAYGGANANLRAPSATLAIAGAVVNFGAAALAAPAATVSASGTTSGTGQADLSLALPFSAVGYSGAVSSVTLAGKATLLASGTTGSTGQAALTLPLFELTASGTAQNYGSADLLMPAAQLGATAQAWLIAPAGRLTAIGTAVVAATYEAYSINLTHAPRGRGAPEPIDEVTHYTSFPFTHIVRYQNSYFGVAADGLYLLEGTTDDGAAIPYAVKTCVDDFQMSEKKTAASAYFGGRLGPEATITVYAGEAGAESYAFITPRGQLAQNHREKFGRGVKDRYLAIGVAGAGTLELDNIELDITKLTRRI